MSNLLLLSLREAGVIVDPVLPFARAKSAADTAKRLTETTPETPRTVMVLDGANTGDYWVVSEADAERLEAKGYIRYVSKPDVEPADEPPEQ